MHILIDLRCCQSPPPRGGVALYAEEAVRALIAHANAERGTLRLGSGQARNAERPEFLLFANGLSNPRRALPTISAPNARWMITRWSNKFLHGAWSLQLAAGSFREADTVFLPNLNFLPRLPARTRLVVTVHDLSFEHFPDLFTRKQRLWHRLVRPRTLLTRADAIIAVSETTKRDVMETYEIPEEKVRVVYPGITNAECRMQNAEWSEHPSFPYILSLSELSPRKNVDGLVAAFEIFSSSSLIPHPSSAPLHLVIAGKRGAAERVLRRQIARSPVRDRIHLLGPVSESEKSALLARAHVFAYPSFWEGFGFPPLEAMVAGVPVVASAAGSLPEVLGDAALLADPLDPAAIARALTRACTDDALRGNLIAKGHARAARYTWERAGVQLLNILVGERAI